MRFVLHDMISADVHGDMQGVPEKDCPPGSHVEHYTGVQTASSTLIMDSVYASKGDAAGSLEAAGYELGTGLGITLIGVFMSVIFGRNLGVPAGLPADTVNQATISMGDTYLVARQLVDAQAEALIAAGKAAFSTTHSVLLMTTAVLFAGLAVLVFFLLAGVRKNTAWH